MSDVFDHCVKLARRLALTSTLLLPACVGAEDPTPEIAPPPPASPHQSESRQGLGAVLPPEALVLEAAALVAPPGEDPTADAGVPDAAGPHTSGPLPPPELPRGFALA